MPHYSYFCEIKTELMEKEFKIIVNWEVSCQSGDEVFDLSSLNCETKEQWDELSEEEKEERIQDALDNLPERVSIVLDTYKVAK
jgi:hypothetical protein